LSTQLSKSVQRHHGKSQRLSESKGDNVARETETATHEPDAAEDPSSRHPRRYTLREAVLNYFSVARYVGQPERGCVSEMSIRAAMGMSEEEWVTALREWMEAHR
jgi:hypothetical protein